VTTQRDLQVFRLKQNCSLGIWSSRR